MKLYLISAVYLYLVCSKSDAAKSVYDESKLCNVGRVFVGNINESLPHYLHLNGIYIKQSFALFNDRPTYKHEARDQFLYYVTPTQFVPGRWVVGNEIGSTDVLLSSQGTEVASRDWSIWLTESQTWTSAKLFKSVCVGEEFVTCTSGRVQLLGNLNTTRHSTQTKRLGAYRLTEMTNELRPIYANDQSGEFIFYKSGKWIVGPDVTKDSGGMFVLDGAWRPEYIVNDWIAVGKMGRPYLSAESSIKLTCQLKLFLYQSRGERINNTREINTTLRSRLKSLKRCSSIKCSNRGACEQSSSNCSLFHCRCEEGFFGPKCIKRIWCETALMGDNYTGYVAHTGYSFLQVKFAVCPPSYKPLAGKSYGIVCQYNSTWSQPSPSCPDDSHLLTPQKAAKRQ